MRAAALSLMLASAAIIPVAAQAVAQSYQLNIPRQQLDAALKDLAEQTGLQIARFNDTPGGGAYVGPVSGNMPISDALKTLLAPNKLTYKIVNDHTIAVMTLSAASAAVPSIDALTPIQATSPPDGDAKRQEGQKSSSGGFRVALLDLGANPQPPAIDNSTSNSQDSSKKTQLTEIVVTAQKRTERLQDVPIPVSVLSADTLVDNNQLRLQDYSSGLPGLTFLPSVGANGGGTLSIRGIFPIGGSPTVGVVIDDVPFVNSFGSPPDIDPSDLQQVEVLRGPQGTLYGANSMGGLFKFVTVDPSFSGWTGRIQADVDSVQHGEGSGYSFRGAVNGPLNDTLAVQISGFGRRDPGYIDDIETGQRGVNWANVSGGHFAALWKPSETFSIKLSALYQNATVHGYPYAQVGSGFGDLQQSTIANTGWAQNVNGAYSLIAKARLGAADLTFLSGYNTTYVATSVDLTSALGGFTLNCFQGVIPASACGNYHGFGTTGTSVISTGVETDETEELRLALPIGSHLDWMLGLFYINSHLPAASGQQIYAVSNTGKYIGFVGELGSEPGLYEEYAAFSNITVHFTDQFSVQVGGRESHNREQSQEIDTGPYAMVFEGGSPVVHPQVNTSANDFTYLITPQFRISPDVMAYARVATGYRQGGTNVQAAVTAAGVPLQYSSDTTKNYEIGFKADTLNHALSFDTSIYYIDWTNIQLNEVNPLTNLTYTANAGHAKSQGVEVSVNAKPWVGLTVASSFVFSDAVLTQGFPATSTVYAGSGDSLPFVSRFSGNVSLQQEFALGLALGFVGGTVTYVGDRLGPFPSPPPAVPPRTDYPAYTKMDVHTGAKYEYWTVTLFCSNLANKRGLLYGGIGTLFPALYEYIDPRTVGLSVSKSFK